MLYEHKIVSNTVDYKFFMLKMFRAENLGYIKSLIYICY